MKKFKSLEKQLNRMKELSGIKEEKILDESGFARINRILWGDVPSVNSVGILTAENPQGKKLPPEENNKLTEDLKRKLKQYNYGYIIVKGRFKEETIMIENSFIIPNIKRNSIIWLGNKYKQKSVIYGERTDKNTFLFEYIKHGEKVDSQEVVLTKLEGDEEYYSYLPKTIKKDGQKIKYERSFRIPFFDEDGYRESTGKGTWKIKESSDFLELKKENLPKDNKEINKLIEIIKENEKELLLENRTEKHYWECRGIIKVSVRKINKLIK